MPPRATASTAFGPTNKMTWTVVTSKGQRTTHADGDVFLILTRDGLKVRFFRAIFITASALIRFKGFVTGNAFWSDLGISRDWMVGFSAHKDAFLLRTITMISPDLTSKLSITGLVDVFEFKESWKASSFSMGPTTKWT
eukprot:scaffold15649_cov152-Cylindrotheca_fusiformis.AAC.1